MLRFATQELDVMSQSHEAFNGRVLSQITIPIQGLICTNPNQACDNTRSPYSPNPKLY